MRYILKPSKSKTLRSAPAAVVIGRICSISTIDARGLVDGAASGLLVEVDVTDGFLTSILTEMAEYGFKLIPVN